MTHIATAAIVKVSIGSAAGNRVARLVRRGEVVPDGVDEALIDSLEQRGLIEPLPSLDELAAAEEQIAREAAEQREAEFDAKVEAAVEKRLAELTPPTTETPSNPAAPETPTEPTPPQGGRKAATK